MKKLIILVILVLFTRCNAKELNNKKDVQTSKDKLREVFERKFGIKIDKNGEISKEQKELANLIIKNKFMETVKKLSQNKEMIKEVNLKMKIKAHALNGLALMKQVNQVNIDGAITEMKMAINIAEKNFPKEAGLLGTLYYNLGSTYALLKISKAISYLKKAIKFAKLSSSLTYMMPSFYHQLAVAHRNIGDYTTSLKNYEISLKLKKKYSFPDKDLTSTYIGLADLYNHLEDYTKSLELNKKALLLRPNSLSNSTIYSNMSFSYIKLKDYVKALTHAKKSLKLIKSKFKKNMFYFGGIYALLGEIYFHLENYTQSLLYFKKSLNSAQLVSKNRLFIAARYNDIAKSYYEINQLKKAYTQLKLGFDMFITLKENSFLDLSQEHKKTYTYWIRQHSNFLESLFQIGYSYKKDNQNVLNRWLNYKRSIFDIENSLKILYANTTEEEIKQKINSLFENQRKLARLTFNPPIDENQIKYYNKRVKKTKEKISKLEIFLNKKILNLNSKPITYQNITDVLKPNELYIDFARMDETYFYFTLDKQKNIKFEKFTNKESQEVEKIITRIREDSGKHFNIKISQKRYAKLYDLIISKIDIQNKTSLIISPDGLLGLIPFEAFYDGEKYLVEKINISYIPSGKELFKLYKHRTATKSEAVVLFSEIDFDKSNSTETKRGTIFDTLEPNWAQLKFSKYETEVIQKLFKEKVKCFLGDKATESNLLGLNAPKILHLSTHGFFSKVDKTMNPMEKSFILLSGANESIRNQKGDGLISALELAGLNLKGTELLVLSACETGVGEIEEAEGVAGMNKAFMKAGANYIVMSLWNVDDEATAKLMEYFYQNIQQGDTYRIALNKAKRSMIKSKDVKESHPYFWSGFIGSGK